MDKSVKLKELILMEKELIEDKMKVLHGVIVKGWRIRRIDRKGRGYLEARKGKKSLYLGRCKSLFECEEMITLKEEEEMLKKWAAMVFD